MPYVYAVWYKEPRFFGLFYSREYVHFIEDAVSEEDAQIKKEEFLKSRSAKETEFARYIESCKHSGE